MVRHALGALAEAIELPCAVIENIRLAVTEACTNVVRHAYPEQQGTEQQGTIDVVVRRSRRGLEVLVADEGRGLGPSADTTGPGLGLPLIAALTDSLEIDRTPRAGCRLVMSFLRPRATPAMGLA